ncbi:MAG: GGDEF domain-containing protein [Comamonas sp.]
MNLSAAQYYALLAPVSICLLGGVLVACWWVQRRPRQMHFFLWLAAGYVLPSLALGAQSLMGNAQLSQWALVTGVLYLGGAWSLAQGMAQRFGQGHAHPWLALVLILVTLGALYHYAWVDEHLWMRMRWLNLSLVALKLLAMGCVWRAARAEDHWERWLCWSYLLFAVFPLLRPIGSYAIPALEGDLTSSGYWLANLAVSMLFTLWFSVLLLACSIRDVVSTLREERNRDPLTSLLNRRAFMEAAETLLNDRRSGPWAVAVGDIDYFKRVNDNWGHACGDQVLQGVSQVLQQQVRSGDLVSRFGGEEFVLLLQRAHVAEAEQVLQRIRCQLGTDDDLRLPNGQVVTLSFGLAPVDGVLQLTSALSRADALLYEAKQCGRDRVHVEGARPLPVAGATAMPMLAV